jgi:hypothetical protein
MYKILGGDGKEYGPVSADTLRQWMAEGRANAQTQVLPEGAGSWVALGALPEFAGAAVPSPVPMSAPQAVPGLAAAPGSVPNYLVQSIIVTLCCCIPFGIPAIVYAAQVNTKLAAGDVAGAQDSSGKAKMWCWIAFGVGIVANVIVGAIQVIAIAAGQ